MTKIKIITDKKFSDLTTFRVGGPIKYYVEVGNDEEIKAAFQFAKENKIKIFILGGGSDILVSDEPFDGLVLKYIGTEILVDGEMVTAEAGAVWDDVVKKAVDENLQGIECLSGIPGSAGAAPVQNIGAYGQEIKDTFEKLEAYDIALGKKVTFTNIDCNFSYRESIFKNKEYWQKYLITKIFLKLKKNGAPSVKYESLKKDLDDNDQEYSLKTVRESVLKIRAGKFENPNVIGNAGSFFKNPIIDKEKALTLMENFPEISCRLQDDGRYKCFAGWMIESAGWKGKTYKTAGVSPRHALILINPTGTAKAQDVHDLSEKIIEDVYKKFGVKLDKEVQFINFNGKF